MKKYLILLISISIFISHIFSAQTKSLDYSKGPLYGKNMYLLFLIYYNFPGLRATEGEKYEFQYHLSTYLIQDFAVYKVSSKKYNFSGRYYDKEDITRDYESIVTELSFSFNILKNLQLGLETRFFSYSGGYLDSVVESLHHGLNLPGGGREYFLQNRIYVDIPNDNNIKFHLEKPAFSFGDIDLWIKYTFYQRKIIALACMGGFKIPAGNINSLSGSGYPDFAAGILVDFKPFWFFSMYFQSGVVIPFDLLLPVESKPNPMYNGLIGIELNPLSFFSLATQFNIKTSPIKKGDLRFSWNVNIDAYSLPQINTLVGFIFKYKNFKWQVYFEEDSFTNQGTDWTINIMFSNSVILFK